VREDVDLHGHAEALIAAGSYRLSLEAATVPEAGALTDRSHFSIN